MSVAACNARFATLLAQGLAANGVRHVVISPGMRSTPLVLAFAAAPQVVTHVVVDERVAGFLALGLARGTAQAVVLLCTSGTAGAHYLPAVIEASQAGVPLIVLTADRPADMHHCGAAQTIEQHRLFGVHARWAADLGVASPATDGRWLGSMATQAYHRATAVDPGPVHLNVAFREPLWEPAVQHVPAASVAAADGRLEQEPPAPRLWRGPARLTTAALAQVAERLLAARRGVILCGPTLFGGMGEDAGMARAVGQLAQALGWPVVADATSQVRWGAPAGAVVVAAADIWLRHAPFVAAHEPDCVLCFGQTPTSKQVQRWLVGHGRGRTLLVNERGVWSDPTHSADTLIVAEPVEFCTSLVAAAAVSATERSAAADWPQAWAQVEARAQAVLAQHCQGGPVWEGAVARRLAALLPDGAALHVSSSMPVRDLDSFAAASGQRLRVCANRGANGIEGTLSTALGEALAWPHAPMVVLCGDLAFLHDLGGLAAAAQHGAHLVVVVVNNGGGGIFDHLPIAQVERGVFERFFRTPPGMDVGAIARAHQAAWVEVRRMEQFEPAVAASLLGSGLHVIEVMVAPQESLARRQAAVAAVLGDLRAWAL